ncbi:MAG: T9SS type A sorting domain-containing protein [Actinobacteria bacterium]|nr:T9SS type A sorting domain-containing protein [Actinomycetota bacterium]
MKSIINNLFFKISIVVFIVSACFSSIYSQNSNFLENYYWGESGYSYYILNKNLIHEFGSSDKDLFRVSYKGSIVYMDENTLLTFIIDPVWNRIVYANYHDTWIKAYGVYGSGIGELKHPKAIAEDGLGNIYVADINNSRIVKLQYDNSNNRIDPNYFVTFGASYLSLPNCVEVDDRGNTSYQDDIIWVADKSVGKIFPFTQNGTIWENGPIEFLYNPSTGQYYHDLTGICGIAIRKSGTGVNSTSNRRLYLVDWKLNKLFLVEAEALENGSVNIYKEVSFSQGTNLSDVESDYFGDVWVVDKRGNKLYKYTWDLKYLTSLTGINRPTGIASVRKHHLNMAITEEWTNTTGNRTYFHGADIKNLQINTSYTTANFTFTVTNWNSLTAKIYKGSTLIKTLEDGSYIHASGPVSLSWYISNPYGIYTLKLRTDSYEQTNEDYKVYKSVERNFSFPFRVYITGPEFLNYMEIGEYYANSTGGTGSGSISYQWYIKWDGASSWSPKGTTQTVYQKMYNTCGFTLKVCISRDNEYAEDTHYVRYLDDDGAPGPRIPKPVTDIDIPDQFSISQNYPNPFNPATTIHIELPEDIEISLITYNILGQEVGIIEKGIKKAGRYDILWDASDQPSGIYIINFRAGTFVKSYKAVLSK